MLYNKQRMFSSLQILHTLHPVNCLSWASIEILLLWRWSVRCEAGPPALIPGLEEDRQHTGLQTWGASYKNLQGTLISLHWKLQNFIVINIKQKLNYMTRLLGVWTLFIMFFDLWPLLDLTFDSSVKRLVNGHYWDYIWTEQRNLSIAWWNQSGVLCLVSQVDGS